MRTDLAVTALLHSTVPVDVDIDDGAKLPDRPHFEVNLLGSREPFSPPAAHSCSMISDAFSLRRRGG